LRSNPDVKTVKRKPLALATVDGHVEVELRAWFEMYSYKEQPKEPKEREMATREESGSG
jgi:hypothetical protein